MKRLIISLLVLPVLTLCLCSFAYQNSDPLPPPPEQQAADPQTDLDTAVENPAADGSQTAPSPEVTAETIIAEDVPVETETVSNTANVPAETADTPTPEDSHPKVTPTAKSVLSETEIPSPTAKAETGDESHDGDTVIRIGLLVIVISALSAAAACVIKALKRKRGPEKKKTVPVENQASPAGDQASSVPLIQNMPATHGLSGAESCLLYDFGCCQGQGGRDYQEDQFWISDYSSNNYSARYGYLAVVADGMGGMANGRESAHIAQEVFASYHCHMDLSRDIPGQLRDMAVRANQNVYKNNSDKNVVGGSTLVAVEIPPASNEMYWISIGDSLIYLLREGMVNQVNIEHELECRMIQAYLNHPEEGYQVKDIRESELRKLTSSLGRSELTFIDQNLYAFPLKSGDRILLCSDGVSGTLNKDDIFRAMTAFEDAPRCADVIREMVERKNVPHQDNFTAITIFCK